MKKKYALVGIIFVFLLFYFMYIWFSKGRNVSYTVKNGDKSFFVQESYTKNYKNDYPNYYIEITIGESVFNFEIPNSFSSDSYIVSDIKYFKNNKYECILPIFSDDKVMSDVLCFIDSTLYHYSDIKNQSLELDNFVNSLDGLYRMSNDFVIFNNMKIYSDNLDKESYIVLTNYNGIDIVHYDKIESINLFSKDIYTQKLKTMVGKYYVVANYDESHDFHEILVVDITTKKVSKIITDTAISFDSYIQGVVDNEIYLFDRDAKRQYIIDVENKSVILNGTVKTGIDYYSNHKFSNLNAYDAYSDDLYFEMYPMENGLLQVGNKYSGYYYSYIPLNSSYIIKHMHVQNKKIKTYAFTITDTTKILYTGLNIYYIEDDILYMYDHLYGKRNLIQNPEWKFNTSLAVFVYKK